MKPLKPALLAFGDLALDVKLAMEYSERPESGWDQNCKAYFAVTEVPLNYVYILMLVFNVPFT